MQTLGVDLASSAARTATCVIEWAECRASVRRLAVGATDDEIVDLARECDGVGIDAPFGWPQPFVALVSGSLESRSWSPARRDALRYRATDHHVREQTGRWPLSVSSDLIGVVAMRCSGLLQRLGVASRVAHEKVVEVYPAAALRRWGFPARGYKGAKRRAALREIVQQLLEEARWLAVAEADKEHLGSSDDAFDALVSSLVTRAARIGCSDTSPTDTRAGSEGWIVLPKVRSLPALVAPPRA